VHACSMPRVAPFIPARLCNGGVVDSVESVPARDRRHGLSVDRVVAVRMLPVRIGNPGAKGGERGVMGERGEGYEGRRGKEGVPRAIR
jgi:hypothetical protein